MSESATRPVQGPCTSDVATQPLQAPDAGTATQPTQAPGAGPEVLLTGYETMLSDQSLSGGRSAEVTGESESEAEKDGEPASPTSINVQGDVPEAVHPFSVKWANYENKVSRHISGCQLNYSDFLASIYIV